MAVITATSDKTPYHTTITDGVSNLYADISSEKGGQGDGFRPHNLLCAALASCLDITVRMLLERRQLAYETVQVRVDLDRSDPEQTVFLYEVDIIGDIAPQIKQEIIRKAANCPVHKTLSKPLSFQPSSFETA